MTPEFYASESEIQQLFRRARERDPSALNALFSRFREPLKRVIRLRLNPKLNGRVDDSDIVQEVMVDALSKFENYSHAPQLPVFLWLRRLTCLKIAEAHRNHLECQMRDVRREISFSQRNLAEVNSESLANWLLEDSAAAPERIVLAESVERMRRGIEKLSPEDRELIALKHFEQLTFTEIAAVVELPRSTVGRQYLRALNRLRALVHGSSES